MLGIHDVCCYDSSTATCNAQVAAKDSHVYVQIPTRSGLAVHKNIPALVDFTLYERYRGNQMLEYVSFLHVVQGNLPTDEGLWSTWPSEVRYRSV